MFFNFLLRLSLQFKNYLNLFEFHSLIFFCLTKDQMEASIHFFFGIVPVPKMKLRDLQEHNGFHTTVI